MKPINTFPIEDFLEKSRLAIKSNQKSLTLSQKEFNDLHGSLIQLMTRLVGQYEQQTNIPKPTDNVQVKMDGGKF